MSRSLMIASFKFKQAWGDSEMEESSLSCISLMSAGARQREREAEQARRRESLARALAPVGETESADTAQTPQRTPRSTRAADLRREAARAVRGLAAGASRTDSHSCQSTPSPAARAGWIRKTVAPAEQRAQDMRSPQPLRGCRLPGDAFCTPRARRGPAVSRVASSGAATAECTDKIDEAECLAALDEWRVDSVLDPSSPMVGTKLPPDVSPCDVTAVVFGSIAGGEESLSSPASKLSFCEADDAATTARRLLTAEPSFKAHILCVLSADDFGPLLRDPTVARHICQWMQEEQASWPSAKNTLYLRRDPELEPEAVPVVAR